MASIPDPRFATWRARIANKTALGAELEPIFRGKTADAWEAELTARDVGAVRADKGSHLRYLHSDPQPKAIGVSAC